MSYQLDPDTLGFLVADVSRLIRAEIDRRIAVAGLGVTTTEARVLMHIRRAGRLRQNVLAERIGVEAMTVSNTLDRLEARGLVTRSPDPTDRRAKLAGLTPAADAVLEETSKISADVRAVAAGGMDADEWNALLDTLKAARANLVASRSTRTSDGQGAAA